MRNISYEKVIGIVGIILVYLIFIYLTYFPLESFIFYDTTTNSYGINN